MKLSNKLRGAEGNRLIFWCPGCKKPHSITYGENKWNWNGDAENPTINPSILVNYPANPEALEAFKEWRIERICHSFIRNGKIEFLGDCTHELAGKTVDLPDYEY